MATDLSVILDNNSNAFYFSGDWSYDDGTLTQMMYRTQMMYKQSVGFALSGPSFFDFIFEGTSAALFGSIDSGGPQMTAQIDQGTVFNINHTVMGTYKQWFQTPKLSDGIHTITVNCSSGTYIDFAVVTQPVENQTRLAGRDIVVDNDSPSIFYSGHWNRSTTRFNSTNFASLGYPYGNSTHRSSTTGDSFAFQFTGTSVSVYGIFSWFDLGTLVATYTIDGATSEPRTYNSSSSLNQAVTRGGEIANFLHYSSDNLSPDDHTLIVNITIANNLTFVLDYITYKPSFEALTTNTTRPSTTVPSPSLGNPASSSKVRISGALRPAAIVGGIIGVLAIGMFVAILLFLRRKAKRTRDILMYNAQNDANDLHIPNPNLKLQDMSQVLPQTRYPSRRPVKYARGSNPAEQATDSHLPPSNIDNTAGGSANPPPYDDLSSIRPAAKHITTI